MSSENSALDSALKNLRHLRAALLKLHKAMLDSERAEYEQAHGQIRSSGEFFQLVVDDEWFSWLRPISQLIVQIDEALSAKEPMTLSQTQSLLKQAQALLQPVENGTPLEQGYYRAVQRDPDIAFMHAEMAHLLAAAL